MTTRHALLSRPVARSGFSIVEILLAGSLFVFIMTVLFGAVLYGGEGGVSAGNRSAALALADEGLDAFRNIRDETFTNIASGTFGLAVSGSRWITSGTQDVTGMFTRQVIVSSTDIFRRDVTARVSWPEGPTRATSTISLITRLSNWIRSVWTAPVQQQAIDVAGANDGMKIQVQGNFAYLVRNDGTPDFVIVNISNPGSASVSGSLALSGIPNNLAVSGNFAYIASQNNTEELQVVNIANPAAPFVAGTLDLVAGTDATGIFAVGTTVYIGRATSGNDDFFIVNAANPAAPTVMGSLEVGAGIAEVWVTGTTAYLASDSNTQELMVVDVSNPNAPVQIGSLDLAGTTNALAVNGFGSMVLVGQGSTIYKINVATPSAPSLIGSLAVGGTVNDIAVNDDGGTAFLATANTTAEFQSVTISGGGAPVALGLVNLAATVNGVAYDPPPDDRVYLAGTSNTEEFIVLRP